MPFSIVLTIEGSSQLVSLVPSTWVKDSILFWPRTKKKSDLEHLRRDENSVPAENWKNIKCKVKVNGISTFVEGLKLEELYSKFEDTEDEERYVKNQEVNRRHPTLKSVSDDLLDLNADFNIIRESKKRTTEVNKTMMEEKDENYKVPEDKITENYAFENCFFNQNIEANDITQLTTDNITTLNPDPVPENDNLVTLKLDHLNEIISENSSLSTENKTLKESIQRFQNLEQELKRGFAVMQIQIDKIFEFIKSNSKHNNDDTGSTYTKNIDHVIAQKNIEFPIKSIEQLDLLESELMNVDFAKALIKKISKIYGTSGIHKIGKIGLQISKYFFTDELLNQFTWKGIKGSSKLPFITYTNIRDCFYKIVHLADNSCTALEADSFLQNSAIKHSGQRIKRKLCEVSEVSKSKIKRTETINRTTINNEHQDQDMGEVISKNEETPINQEEEIMDIGNTAKENILKSSETEDQIDEKINEFDEVNIPDTKMGSITAAKVTVLSDVKIKSKVMDLKQKSKMQNISSENLINFELFKQDA